MTTYIKKSIDGSRRVAEEKNSIQSIPHLKAKPRSNGAAIRAIGVLAILGTALGLSAKTDYLFFKELTVACSIIGLAMLLKTIRHPAIVISSKDQGRVHLN